MIRRVLLAGEGKTELGGWIDWAAGNDPKKGQPEPGVLEALLNCVCAGGFQVHAAVAWRELRIYRAWSPGKRMHKDELNTRALWLKATEKGCDLIDSHGIAMARKIARPPFWMASNGSTRR
jgi:hypothetical protein